MARVMVAMSGGVDSSVAAYLLREQGHDCVGVTMLLHGGPGTLEAQKNGCCSIDDVEDAKAVARALGITHYAFDFTNEFHEAVVRDFVEGYETGLTPNPCVRCNRHLKFGSLLRRARELGCEYLATGHYAQVSYEGGRHLLLRATDPRKDQSYFLCLLTQGQLARTLLPLGGMTKDEVRAIALEQGFVTARKRESQDVCFVPDGDYRAYLERYRGAAYPPGDVLDLDGHVVGGHGGAVGYTIGQRKGLGVALGEPAYVVAKDMRANTVTVGPLASIMARGCLVREWNWVVAPPVAGSPALRAQARTHYRMAEQPCAIEALAVDGTGSDDLPRVRITFDTPQRAITPGQYAVAYDGDVLLGGGIIERALP